MWRDLALSLESQSTLPLFLQISRTITEDVRRGRLRPGDPLPGSRALSETLRVHRNTVLAAYRELESEGWITTSPARGTFISEALPDPAPLPFSRKARSQVPERLGFPLGPAPEPYAPPEAPKGTLSLGGGVPDLRLVPMSALARAYRRVLRRHGRSVLDYGDPRGHLRLRSALAQMLTRVRGLVATEDTLVVTRGSQMALNLVARAIVSPGDEVAVESYGYRPAWEVLKAAGAKLAPLPIDRDGLRVDALEALCAKRTIRAVYVTPHHQYPTTVVLSAARRLQLLELARRKRFAILEDDYDHEFHYEGRPVLPLASADPHGVVVYVGTLSKILAPGLRLGFVVAPAPLVDRIAALRVFADRQGDHAVECAVAELLEDGEVQRHARRARRIYQARRDVLVDALRKELPSALSFEVPAGGIALWCATDANPEAWAKTALEQKVVIFPAARFRIDGQSAPFARLGFAALNEPELKEAVRRLAVARRAVEPRRVRTGSSRTS